MITYDQILYFDTETTGLPPKDAKWETDYEQFPRICQLSWIYAGREENHIIRPDGWEIPQVATDVHGITNEYAQEHGEPFPVHDAIEDVRAVVRCLPVLVEKGIIELVVKDYPAEQTKIEFPKNAERPKTGDLTGLNEKMDKSPVSVVNAPENEKSPKITLNNRLAEMMADENF